MHHFLIGLLIKLNLDLLVWPALFFGDETSDGFDQADFVVETGWPHYYRSVARARLLSSDCEACAWDWATLSLLL